MLCSYLYWKKKTETVKNYPASPPIPTHTNQNNGTGTKAGCKPDLIFQSNGLPFMRVLIMKSHYSALGNIQEF